MQGLPQEGVDESIEDAAGAYVAGVFSDAECTALTVSSTRGGVFVFFMQHSVH